MQSIVNKLIFFLQVLNCIVRFEFCFSLDFSDAFFLYTINKDRQVNIGFFLLHPSNPLIFLKDTAAIKY